MADLLGERDVRVSTVSRSGSGRIAMVASRTTSTADPAGTVVQVVSGDEVVATWTADTSFASFVLSADSITAGESTTGHAGAVVAEHGARALARRRTRREGHR